MTDLSGHVFGVELPDRDAVAMLFLEDIRPYLRFILEHEGRHIIVDTKCKTSLTGRPADADPKQMLVYNRVFDSKESNLVYPATGARNPVAGQTGRTKHA